MPQTRAKTKLRKFGVEDPDEYWRERVASSRTSEHRIHRFIFQLIRERFPAGGYVLDCGVGDGHVFRLCRQQYNTYGVEFSKEAISRYEFPTDNIAHSDLNNGIPEFGLGFDVIVLSMVLHWLDDPEGFLREAAAKLSSRGRLIIVIPNVTNYHYRIGFLLGKFPPISLSHKNILTPREAEQMFRAAGYEIERMLTSKRSWKARLWPRVFSTGIVYVLKPGS